MAEEELKYQFSKEYDNVLKEIEKLNPFEKICIATKLLNEFQKQVQDQKNDNKRLVP